MGTKGKGAGASRLLPRRFWASSHPAQGLVGVLELAPLCHIMEFGMNSIQFRVIVLGVLGAAGAGCQDGSYAGSTAAVRDSAGVRIVENHDPVWSQGEQWEVSWTPSSIIGVTDGDGDYLLDDVRGVRRLSDGRILVVNGGTAELRFYDDQGRFLAAAGGRGGGPGEFDRYPMQLLPTPGDTLVLLDTPSWNVVRFDGQGAFLDRRQLDRSLVAAEVPAGSYAESVTLLPTGGFMAPVHEIPPSPEPTGHRRPGGYLIVSAAGESTFLEPFPSFDFSSIAFGRSSLLAVGQHSLALGDNATYEIVIHTPRGELVQRIRNMRPNRSVRAEDLMAVRESLVRSARSSEQEAEWGRAFDAADHPATFPAFSAIFIDRLDHVWVRHPPPVQGDSDSPVNWDIYDSDGVFLGELTLPVGLSLHDVGEDYILGVKYDSLGVERVQLHALTRR